MLIAHISDLHFFDDTPIPAARLFNKRFSGWANLKLRRGHHHKNEILESVLASVVDAKPDHIIVTGDLTNLALESEFKAIRELFGRFFGADTDKISVIPGNHDVYTRGAMREGRFDAFFGDYATTDLPELGTPPFVRLRGPVAIIGLTSALPRMPFSAAGELGAEQRGQLLRALEHKEVRSRMPVVLMHHPPHAPASAKRALMESLRDANLVSGVLAHAKKGIVAHGHLHRRIRYELAPTPGEIISFGATSASLEHENVDRHAGFNAYEVDDRGKGLAAAYAFVAVPEGAPERREIPFGSW